MDNRLTKNISLNLIIVLTLYTLYLDSLDIRLTHLYWNIIFVASSLSTGVKMFFFWEDTFYYQKFKPGTLGVLISLWILGRLATDILLDEFHQEQAWVWWIIPSWLFTKPGFRWNSTLALCICVRKVTLMTIPELDSFPKVQKLAEGFFVVLNVLAIMAYTYFFKNVYISSVLMIQT